MRAVIRRFINYDFRNGLLPGHTKPAFNEYKAWEVLTVHKINAMNAFLFFEKIRLFPLLLNVAPSIISTIPANTPAPGSTYCENWF